MRIVEGETIHQAYSGIALQDRFDVHHGYATGLLHGCDFHVVQQGLNVGCDWGLNRTHNDVLAAFLSTAAFIDHAKRFAHAGGIAQEDFQFAALFGGFFLGLHQPKEFLGRASLRCVHR